MKNYVYSYNNCIHFNIEADSENDAYSKLEQKVADIQFQFRCILPPLHCFDLTAAY